MKKKFVLCILFMGATMFVTANALAVERTVTRDTEENEAISVVEKDTLDRNTIETTQGELVSEGRIINEASTINGNEISETNTYRNNICENPSTTACEMPACAPACAPVCCEPVCCQPVRRHCCRWKARRHACRRACYTPVNYGYNNGCSGYNDGWNNNYYSNYGNYGSSYGNYGYNYGNYGYRNASYGSYNNCGCAR